MLAALHKLVEEVRQDLRFTFRQLRQSRVYSAIVIATFAVGIAANAAIFSIMDALVLRPLAVPELSQVVTLAEQRGATQAPSGGQDAISFADYQDFVRQNRTFAQLAARRQSDMILTGSGQSEHITTQRASLNLFDLYRIQPLLGRTFAPGEDQPGRDGEAILTYDFWRTHFASRPDALGQPIALDGRVYTIIGVMPQSFDHIAYTSLWLPLALTPQQQNDRSSRTLMLTGRLLHAATPALAAQDLNRIAAEIARRHPATSQGTSVVVRPLLASINGEYTPFYTRVILFATLLLMLVVCANISNLQFARTMRRAPEMAMRCALGSSRARILRQLMVENIVLSLLGVVAGLVLAQLSLHESLVNMPPEVSRYLAGWDRVGLSPRTLAYSIVVAVAAGAISGLAPAFFGMRVNLVDQLKSGSRSVSGSARSHRLRNLFAGAQITLAAALVTGAALIAASMLTLLNATTRFAPKQGLVLETYLPAAQYATPDRQAAFFDQGRASLATLPAVQSAEFTTALPYGNGGVWWQDFSIVGSPALPGETRTTQRLTVSPGFLASLGIPVLQGRSLLPSDSSSSTPVTLISRRTARQYFGEQNPLGRQLQLGTGPSGTPPVTIVGVVDDVIYTWVDQVPQPAVYLSSAQFPPSGGVFLLHTSSDPLALARPVRQALAAIDPAVPINGLQTYAQFLHQSLIGLSYAATMLCEDAAIALLLCGLGIFGVMANLVTERTHEIGIRFALGADRFAITTLMLRRSLTVTGVGLALGCLLAFEVNRILASVLQGVHAVQGLISLAAIASVALISLLAGYLPARRAAAVDPCQALHAE